MPVNFCHNTHDNITSRYRTKVFTQQLACDKKYMYTIYIKNPEEKLTKMCGIRKHLIKKKKNTKN